MRSPHTTTGEQPPLLVTRESLCAGMKIQHRQKQINEQIFKKKKRLDPIFQHDQPTSAQAMNHQQHLATFPSSKEQNSLKVFELLHQLTLCSDTSVLCPVFHQLHRLLVSLYIPLLLVPLDWRDWIRFSTYVPPHPLAAATPPSHQLDNKLLHFPFTADPHPLASCLKQRSLYTIVKWVNE